MTCMAWFYLIQDSTQNSESQIRVLLDSFQLTPMFVKRWTREKLILDIVWHQWWTLYMGNMLEDSIWQFKYVWLVYTMTWGLKCNHCNVTLLLCNIIYILSCNNVTLITYQIMVLSLTVTSKAKMIKRYMIWSDCQDYVEK